MLGLSVQQTMLLAVTVALAGVWDIRGRRIPNWLTIPAIFAGLFVNGMPGGFGMKAGFIGILVAFAVYLPLYAIRGMGAGDVKLMAAVGAIAGAQNWIAIFLATAIVGGVAALFLVLTRRRYHETMFNVIVLVGDMARFRAPYRDSSSLDVRSSHALRMPHGVSIALGTAIAVCLSYYRFI